MSNYLGVRERGRDSKRKQDLRQIQAALELYRYDLGSYPASLQNCPIATPTYLGNPTCTTGTTYMQKIPTDPQGSTYYNSGSYYYNVPSGNASYTLCTCLENGNDNQGVVDNITCGVASIIPSCSSATGGSGKFFFLQSQ